MVIPDTDRTREGATSTSYMHLIKSLAIDRLVRQFYRALLAVKVCQFCRSLGVGRPRSMTWIIGSVPGLCVFVCVCVCTLE